MALLKRFQNLGLFIPLLKESVIKVMIYTGICDRMRLTRKLPINMRRCLQSLKFQVVQIAIVKQTVEPKLM